MKAVKTIILIIILSLAVAATGGCSLVEAVSSNFSSLVGLSNKGTVINKAYIRSSYAVVAADLFQVKRGDTVEILEETDFEKVHWYRVRANDEDKTEGWIEAQNLLLDEVLEKSKKLAEDNKDRPAQAIGQLRAASNLRLTPEQNDKNLLFKLESGATFEVIEWKYVPKLQEASETDDAKKGEQSQKQSRTKNADVEAAKEANEPEKLDEKYDIWYKVRFDPSVSPAPSGWIFGRQVELQVPSDIVHFQTNKKFVAWHRLDEVDNTEKYLTKDKDAAKVTKPGSWVILTRSPIVKAVDGVEPDFDGILILGFDKYNEEHYQVLPKIGEVWGLLPLRVEGTGDNKAFMLKLRNQSGQTEEKRFTVTADKNRLRFKPPEDIANYEKKDK